MGEEHNVGFGQGPKVNRATSTPTSPSICLRRHIEGEVGVLVALLTLSPCPKPTLCSSPIPQVPILSYGDMVHIKGILLDPLAFILLGFLMSEAVLEAVVPSTSD